MRFGIWARAKSSRSTVRVSLLGGRRGMVNEPSLLVVTFRSKPVAVLLSVTLAPATAAPLASTTVPLRVAVVDWAAMGVRQIGINSRRNKIFMMDKDLNIFSLSISFEYQL